MKFRKKPVVIEAWRVSELLRLAASDWKGLPPQVSAAYERGEVVFACDSISIRTLEGVMVGAPDDFVICGVKGELYPCKPDIFERTYDPAE